MDDISVLFLQAAKGQREEESIKADLIYEASLWLEGGRGAGGGERKMEGV